VKILYLAPELVVRGSTAEPSAALPQQAEAAGGGATPVPLRRTPARRSRRVPPS
jgi:hypothetical protein